MRLVKLIALLLVASSICACKKDSSQKSLPRLKSITNLEGNSSFKTDFHYNNDGALKQTKHYVNGNAVAFTEYYYQGNKVESAKSFSLIAGASAQMMTETDFKHSGNRLVSVEIKSFDNASVLISRVTNNFQYQDGDLPYASITFPRNIIPDPYLDRWRPPGEPPIVVDDTIHTESIPLRDSGLDSSQNPLYRQPYLLARPFARLGVERLSVSFNPLTFFLANNITKASLNDFRSDTIEYEYNSFGLPTKSIRTSSLPSSVKIETIYEYGQ